MARSGWHDLSSRARRIIVAAGAIEGVLKVVALADLRRQPADLVRGSKFCWSIAIIGANSAGAVPIAYLLRGRRST